MKIPQFKTRKELFDFLRENKTDIIYSKKESIKHADGLNLGVSVLSSNGTMQKSAGASNDTSEIKVRAIINTTNVLDSHGDVHIKGIWNKTVKENKLMKHIQEHQMSFKTIIADKKDLEVSVREYSWKDLGYDKDGGTEALVFDSTVKESRNSYMFKQYRDGNVDNHSVGMRYVRLALALNSEEEEDKEEKAVWDKHIADILNKEEAETKGYFWAVYEAKAIEGSAVPIGSNTVTPTLEPTKDTQDVEQDAAESAHLKSIINFLNKTE